MTLQEMRAAALARRERLGASSGAPVVPVERLHPAKPPRVPSSAPVPYSPPADLTRLP